MTDTAFSADTVFSKILRGELPCHRVFEDAHVLAFLDIAPLSHGHVLVVPKEPAPTLDALSEDAAAALGRVLPRICRAVMQVTGVRDYNVLQNNGAAAHQAVFHVHFHIIPKPSGLQPSAPQPSALVPSGEAGLSLSWRPGALDQAVGATLAQALSDALAAE